MWKAAHLRLAKWLLNQEELEDFGRHKIAFLVGSILPDCMPSFVTKRHRLEDTFFVLKEEIQKFHLNKSSNVVIQRRKVILAWV